jgi:hypothetical protein
MRGRMGVMDADKRTRPARSLAELDQLLAEAEEIALDPTDGERDSALDFWIEFQETRRDVETRLRGE